MNFILYLTILIAKMIEVSIGTTRIVLITKGERVMGACLGFVEVIIWVIIVSTVLTDVTKDPVKVVVYAIGFGLGNYVGSLIENRIGIGTIRLEAIVMEEHGLDLANALREEGYAVTMLDGKGMNNDRHVLLLNIKRKKHDSVVEMIKSYQNNVVITINDIKPVYGGYGILKR